MPRTCARWRVGLTLLAVLFVLQPLSSAQDHDTEDVFVESVTDPEQEEEGIQFPLTTEQPLKDEVEHQQEDAQISDNSITRTTPDNGEDEIVHTTGGPVIGSTYTSSDGVEVSVYYGIPYAAAPIGSLRFRPPVRVAPWKTPKIAAQPVAKCYQELKYMKGMDWVSAVLGRPWTEDCLTLSVWAPKPKIQGAPVLVNVHGGAFILGSSLLFTDGTVMASNGVILVSMNYRLSVFGFFSLGHPEAPGNVGLMDQTLALQWVQENAAAFGGDPGRVTLVGVSAGGASVGYHLLSPMSKGLFSAAIVMGGSPNNPWAVKEAEHAVLKSNTLLASVSCANTNLTLSLDCIRQKDAEDIAQLPTLRNILTSENFIPTVDGQFMTEHPDVHLEAGRIESDVPVIIGTSENEGSTFLALLLQNQDGRIFRREIRDLIHVMDKRLTTLQVKALDVLYTNWSSPDDPFLLRDGVIDLYGDYLFICGVNKLTNALTMTGSNVYRYVFGHPFGSGPTKAAPWMGTPHASELRPFLAPEESDPSVEDATVTKEFRRRIVNFVKTRNPNQRADGTLEEFSWPQYNLRHKSYYHVTVNPSVKASPRTRECKILEELLPALASVGKDC